MFGAGLPVCARSFAALPEPVPRKVTSRSLKMIVLRGCAATKAGTTWRKWLCVQQL